MSNQNWNTQDKPVMESGAKDPHAPGSDFPNGPLEKNETETSVDPFVKEQRNHSKRQLKMQCIDAAIKLHQSLGNNDQADKIVETAGKFYNFARR